VCDIPLTGDPDADADIMAFIQARQKLAQRGRPLLDNLSVFFTAIIIIIIIIIIIRFI